MLRFALCADGVMAASSNDAGEETSSLGLSPEVPNSGKKTLEPRYDADGDNDVGDYDDAGFSRSHNFM